MDHDDVDDFFNFSKPFKRIEVAVAGTKTAIVQNTVQQPDRSKIGTEYIKQFVRDEEQKLLQAFVPESSKESVSHMDDVDDTDEMADDNMGYVNSAKARELMLPLFQRYNFIVQPNSLAISASKEKILKSIDANPVVILQGPTGCGKTTQVPQFLLEQAFRRQEYCNIIVTQPRKIAAISIAKRVAHERGCDVGTLVGFKVGLKQKISDDVRLLYVSTGVLLHSLVSVKNMSSYTHVILDEVHEREIDMDFLLILVRRFLATNSSNTKVILMSATINAIDFSNYFKTPKTSGYLAAPVIPVDSTRQFQVKEFYFDDLDKLRTDFNVDYATPGISYQMYQLAAKLVCVCDRLNENKESNGDASNTSIIIFLPGIHEICRMEAILKEFVGNIKSGKISTMWILKLHSALPSEEQSLVFQRAAPGFRKVILSTNIAESSVTVPDIQYVIDFCLQRMLVTDTVHNFSRLCTAWASKSNCIQRAGRAGRVMSGRVYRLVHREFYVDKMEENMIPEILTSPLDTTVLKTKLLDMGPPHSILALAMNPPDLSDIRNTILHLKELGAILRTARAKYDALDGDLTYMGRFIAQLPVDLRMGKLIVFGYLFSVLEEAIIIAAGMNVKNIFIYRGDETIREYAQKMRWSHGSGSDGIAILNAYTAWRSRQEQNYGQNIGDWCKRMSLDQRSLVEMADLIKDIKDRMSHTQLHDEPTENHVTWSLQEKTIILKVIMAGAFYPYYFSPLTVGIRDQSERELYSELGCRDPCNTVILTGFDHKYHIGPLYSAQIKRNLSDNDPKRASLMKVEFDTDRSKVYVRFHNPEDTTDNSFMPGKVHQEVYKAVKLRKLSLHKNACVLRVMKHEEAIEYATKCNIGAPSPNGLRMWSKMAHNLHLSVEPLIHQPQMICEVTYIEDCSKFYLRPSEDMANGGLVHHIQSMMNAPERAPLKIFPPEHLHRAGDIVAVMLPAQCQYYRVVLKGFRGMNEQGPKWSVFSLDTGYTGIASAQEFRQLDGPLEELKKYPQRVLEARLCEVQPRAMGAPQGIWTRNSTDRFRELTTDKVFMANIYSYVNRVASVHLCVGDELSINQRLIFDKLAQFAEESYISKEDHDIRRRKQREISLDENLRRQVYSEAALRRNGIVENEYVEDVNPPTEKLVHDVHLKGPYSPLEINVAALIQSGIMKTVSIVNESVNNVLLDTNPQDTHERLLIAGYIGDSRDRLSLRYTSLMPNIPGFPSLMTLIFCPLCEFKMDSNGTRVLSILAGLGCDENTGMPYYPEHDLSVQVDVEIDQDDISNINLLRYAMDTILQTDAHMNRMFDNSSIGNLKQEMKKNLVKILDKERNRLEVIYSSQKFRWTTVDIAGPSKKQSKPLVQIYDNSIFPLHKSIELRSISSQRLEYFRTHCDELLRLDKINMSLPKGGIMCQLCNANLNNLHELRIHLHCKLHRDRKQQIGYQ